MTLREALARVRDYGRSVELRTGMSGRYGERGRHVTPASLLTALSPGELDRPVLLVWDHGPRRRIPTASVPLGQIHLYTPGGHADPSPALWIVEREVSEPSRA